MKPGRRFDSVVIVGSSGTGKTTLVNGLRTLAYSQNLAIPRRYITRPRREGTTLSRTIILTTVNLMRVWRGVTLLLIGRECLIMEE